MDTLWPLVVVIGTFLVLVALIRNGRRLFPGTRSWAAAFWCPFRGRDVEAHFEETVWEGKRLDVTDCSAFTPTTKVTCDKACLGSMKG